MSLLAKFGLLLSVTSLLLSTPIPAFADHARTDPPCVAVAFLVHGFSGCCITKKVKDFLEEKGACIHVSNWNDIDRKGNPGDYDKADVRRLTWKARPNPESDEPFIRDMQEAIKNIPKSTPLILIGHSFGGDVVLQVSKRIEGRKIAFLAVLDGVGRGGLRKNITQPVPKNVEYFFNRWQQNLPLAGDHIIPFDRVLSGKIESDAEESNQKKQNTEKTKKCKTKHRDPFKKIPQLLSHGEIPKDSCIQQKIKNILDERVFG